VALLLNRFSMSLPIIYASNARILAPVGGTEALNGRSIFDFVRARDERTVRAWLEACKGWGAWAGGGPGGGGGFGYGRFKIVPKGRNSKREESRRRRERDLAEAEAVVAMADQVGASTNGGKVPRRATRPAARGGSSTHTIHRKGAPRAEENVPEAVTVDAIFSAHSDGLLLILRLAPEGQDWHEKSTAMMWKFSDIYSMDLFFSFLYMLRLFC
jgi:hypothetical protein